jgi:hypothetical protein
MEHLISKRPKLYSQLNLSQEKLPIRSEKCNGAIKKKLKW